MGPFNYSELISQRLSLKPMIAKRGGIFVNCLRGMDIQFINSRGVHLQLSRLWALMSF